jgi:hypothetical protein
MSCDVMYVVDQHDVTSTCPLMHAIYVVSAQSNMLRQRAVRRHAQKRRQYVELQKVSVYAVVPAESAARQTNVDNQQFLQKQCMNRMRSSETQLRYCKYSYYRKSLPSLFCEMKQANAIINRSRRQTKDIARCGGNGGTKIKILYVVLYH